MKHDAHPPNTINRRQNLLANGIHLFELGLILLTVTALWIVWSWCCYAFFEGLGLTSGYDDAPGLFASYNLIWSGIALMLSAQI
jgi:hypothetical protein